MTVAQLKQALNKCSDEAIVICGVHNGNALFAVSTSGAIVRLNFDKPSNIGIK